MMKTSHFAMAVSSVMALTLLIPAVAHADAISPSIKDRGKTYSTDAPDVSYYGSGIGARYMESSMLRFEVDRLLQDADYDKAIARARKATQLDPACPDNHYLLAKALTRKLQQTDPIDEKLLGEAMYEWRLIWIHDADQSEQAEAKLTYLRLRKAAMGIAKRKQVEAKTRQKTRGMLAQTSSSEHSGEINQAPENNLDSQSGDDDRVDTRRGSQVTADSPKHKRLLLF